ncbi:Similar to hypothetical protein CIMG_02666 [Coccidioides immitis RS]; acc. no. XP_001248895 [Pyronema omphalodes CBS 100304]|uniref:Uncharacterized protein n=1 Tax=Pyronema omphalodes (strain CBS 100304) TaxID=1076935 RepID=U4LIV5_PYROM|nr:Similar to hypothetical protein CIMG_02666 [Coccidioides immitis RS]; acc. no. XP_001248895 [Pyronema omphalodes CBS 100304]
MAEAAGCQKAKDILTRKAGLKKLVRDLKTENAVFQNTCTNLLQGIFVPEEVSRLMKGEGWDDAGIRDAFRDSIGSDTTELFLDYIKEFSTAIDNVRSDIGLDGNMKSELLDNEGRRRQFNLIKTAYRKDDILNKMASTNKRLTRLLGQPASSLIWHELEFRPVRLLKDDDYSETVGPDRMVSQKNQPWAIDVDETPSPAKKSHRSSFAGSRKGKNRKDRPSVSSSVPTTGPKFQGKIPDETSRRIVDLCGDIQEAIHGVRPSELGLIDIGPNVCEAETVSLETLIKRKMLISRKSRLQLGVQLAVAIMQLRMSGWLEAAWGKQDIFFLVHKDLQRRDADGNSTPNLLSTSLSFADLLEDSSFQTHCRPDYDPSTIESLATDYNALCQHKSNPYYAIAKLLIGEINEKHGLDYGSAVSRCVGMGIAATGDGLSLTSKRTLENPKFRSEIYGSVLQTLENNYKACCGIK